MEHVLNLHSNENNWNDVDKSLIKAFLEYLLQVLVIKDSVKIDLHSIYEGDEVKVAIDLRLAYVLPDQRQIIIYCKNRGLLDVLRSIAHEMIHIEQKDTGKLTDQNIGFYLPTEASEGYDLEYEAYGKSGIIVRNFRAILNGSDGTP